jgi:hypothetical protein
VTTPNITVRTSDILDPNVKAITIMVSARGFFDEATVRDTLRQCGLDESQLPGHVNLNTALRRAMQDVAKGDRETGVVSKGRGSNCVFTVARTDLDRIDLEVDDGRGITNAEVSARIQVDPTNTDSYYLRISPPDHYAATYIRQQFDEHCGRFSATYDLKVWWTQKFKGSIGAMRTGRALGEYVVPFNSRVANMLLSIKEKFSDLSATGKFRVYLSGETTDSGDAVDMITDAIIEEAERVSKATREALNKRQVGVRGLNAHAQRAVQLHDRLEKLGKSFGCGLDDVDDVVNELQKHIGASLAQLNVSE